MSNTTKQQNESINNISTRHGSPVLEVDEVPGLSHSIRVVVYEHGVSVDAGGVVSDSKAIQAIYRVMPSGYTVRVAVMGGLKV